MCFFMYINMYVCKLVEIYARTHTHYTHKLILSSKGHDHSPISPTILAFLDLLDDILDTLEMNLNFFPQGVITIQDGKELI